MSSTSVLSPSTPCPSGDPSWLLARGSKTRGDRQFLVSMLTLLLLFRTLPPSPQSTNQPPMSRLRLARALHTPSAPLRPRPLRIFALPLAPTPSSPARTPLIYWHVSQHAPIADAGDTGASIALDVRDPASWIPYGINKASAFWLSWGQAPRGVVDGGEKVEWSERVKGWKYWV